MVSGHVEEAGGRYRRGRKARVLLFLCLAELLAMAVWFCASAVVPALTGAWKLGASGRAWLTMSVQIGFVAGALVSAVLNLADRLPARLLFTASALLSALTTALIPLLAVGLYPALVLRFLTGFFLAGVYPVGMKIMATWTQKNRGLGIGLLVGALTVGSAVPHLLKSVGPVQDWQSVLYLAAGLSLLGGLLALVFVAQGPHAGRSPAFNWKYVGRIFRQKELVLANLGYLGHMWELYAVWTWLPIFLLASFKKSGLGPGWASLTAFAVIAVGGLGSLAAGWLADRLGRTLITTACLIVSGCCCLTVGFLYGHSPLLLTVLCLVWGFSVVADSAQFSAAISELSEPAYMGTALTLQTSLGFLLTLFSIRLVASLEQWWGWGAAFAGLAVGPIVGILGMLKLRRLPQAKKMANGRG
jgi:MFS family permease